MLRIIFKVTIQCQTHSFRCSCHSDSSLLFSETCAIPGPVGCHTYHPPLNKSTLGRQWHSLFSSAIAVLIKHLMLTKSNYCLCRANGYSGGKKKKAGSIKLGSCFHSPPIRVRPQEVKKHHSEEYGNGNGS